MTHEILASTLNCSFRKHRCSFKLLVLFLVVYIFLAYRTYDTLEKLSEIKKKENRYSNIFFEEKILVQNRKNDERDFINNYRLDIWRRLSLKIDPRRKKRHQPYQSPPLPTHIVHVLLSSLCERSNRWHLTERANERQIIAASWFKSMRRSPPPCNRCDLSFMKIARRYL